MRDDALKENQLLTKRSELLDRVVYKEVLTFRNPELYNDGVKVQFDVLHFPMARLSPYPRSK